MPSPYRCAFLRLFYDSAMFPMTECVTVSLFSPISHVNEFAYIKPPERRREVIEWWQMTSGKTWRAIWYDFYLRLDDLLDYDRVFDVGYRDDRSQFRLRWFHVRIDTIYARLIFPVGDDSVLIVSLMFSKANWLFSHRLLISCHYRSMHMFIDTYRFKKII